MRRGSFAEALKVGRKTFPGELYRFVGETSEFLADRVQHYTPEDTGALKKSIRPMRTRRTGPHTWQGGARTNITYASFVEDDTRPHRIPVIRTSTGQFVPIKGRAPESMVLHPGTKGQHMFARGAADTEAAMDNRGEQFIRRWAALSGL